MHPALQRRFDLLEQRKQTFMGVLERATPAQQGFKPDGGWNMLQVGEHLALAEYGLLTQAIKGQPVGPNNLRATLTFWAIVAVFKTPTRVKAPPRAAVPEKELTLEALAALWQRNRTQLREYLEAQPGSALSKPALNHPFVKPMTLGQALLFCQVHLEHHMHQLERIRKAEGYPV